MKILNKLMSILHLLVMPAAILLALTLSLKMYILANLLYLLHIYVFKGCVITQIQKKLNGLPKNVTFTQYYLEKLYGVPVSLKRAAWLNIGFYSMLFVLSLFKAALVSDSLKVSIAQLMETLPNQLSSIVLIR